MTKFLWNNEAIEEYIPNEEILGHFLNRLTSDDIQMLQLLSAFGRPSFEDLTEVLSAGPLFIPSGGKSAKTSIKSTAAYPAPLLEQMNAKSNQS